MPRDAGRPLRLIILLVLAAATTLAPVARASTPTFPLRSPQVPFDPTALTTFVDSVGAGFGPLTDQLDAQVFPRILDSTNSLLVWLMQGSGCEVGLYDAGAPDTTRRFPVIVPTDPARAQFVCHAFTDGSLRIQVYDTGFNLIRTTLEPGFPSTNLGFYIRSAAGTWYSQDALDGGRPQALTYAGHGAYTDDFFECFEPAAYDPLNPREFAGVILGLMPTSTCGWVPPAGFKVLVPTCVPVRQSTWGAIKVVYR